MSKEMLIVVMVIVALISGVIGGVASTTLRIRGLTHRAKSTNIVASRIMLQDRKNPRNWLEIAYSKDGNPTCSLYKDDKKAGDVFILYSDQKNIGLCIRDEDGKVIYQAP